MTEYGAGWCRAEATRLLDFHAASVNPDGGFYKLAADGTPLPDPTRELHETTRMVHAYAQGHRLRHPAAAAIVDHGVRFLLDGHYDPVHGGFWWSVGDDGPSDRRKQAYGHAFVLLAAASAHAAGHPEADRLRGLAMDAIRTHFWEGDPGAVSDTFDEDWTNPPAYRGGNANMHLTEALLAAHASWRDAEDLDMARRIAGFMIDCHARAEGWVVPEHFTPDWQIDRDFAGDPMFRPPGTTPGHAIEWARLVLELRREGGEAARDAWTLDAARALHQRALSDAWLPEGGLAYTMGWDGRIDNRRRLWWPLAEAIATAHELTEATGDEQWLADVDKFWRHLDRHHIDHVHGGWFAEIGQGGETVETLFPGKPDIYHAMTACMAGTEIG
ncbi:Mannose or cellobiose epimerase, N-acyl-D-glucosamine 2-epimerase family [Paracoccus isoporae]|uniref:Mannose or cellobiose epimerase, N-acyl-D-glucosamine 2-epimerase family n=1 Tax=Paracoccus isoporae TaxID=591205 RepID=A0A1G6XPU2_9RHOB|nr:AGE family epimerase/isomerase [Paracoccus isoporae]SDD80160.1 Mannose or cellobiose epimerase, N-acyl-D-glucosamine 2-epimerase family [Paracoccus isoporae]